jgi:hypothetical protein
MFGCEKFVVTDVIDGYIETIFIARSNTSVINYLKEF